MQLHWLHMECLSDAWLEPDSGPAVYVFDDAQHDVEQWGIKRIGFLYECLLELPVDLHHGDLITTLPRLAREAGCASIRTVAPLDPWLRSAIAELRRQIPVDLLEPPPFVSLSGRVDLKRFSRYWQKAEAILLP
jgi:hypothetical protein